MHKHYDFGYPCHIPSICKHNFFRKDKFVMYLVYYKLPKDANGYGIQDGRAELITIADGLR